MRLGGFGLPTLGTLCQLLAHGLEIEVVPSFRDLSLTHMHQRDPGEFDTLPGGRMTAKRAGVDRTHQATRHGFIALGYRVHDLDVDLGEGAAKASIEALKGC